MKRACRVLAVWLALAAGAVTGAAQGRAGPVVVVQTSKGSFAFETFPREAPKTVAHVLGLVRRGFYDGQRVHRAVPGFVAGWGDPRSRDPASAARWGRGREAASGTPLGAVEMSGRGHVAGAVGIAHPGNPAAADSQVYVVLAPRPELDGYYTVFGQVIAGAGVPARLERGDTIIRMFVRE